jgi:N-methylhydantoinase B
MSQNIDPITFEVLKNALASIADEMALIVVRSAYSPVVRDTMDFSTALCDRHGDVVAQGLTLAVQLGAFPDMMRHITSKHAADAKPGDVFIANDPYGSGGQHLPDIYIIKPIFHDGELEGYAATMAHHCDVGGITPGSVAMHATEVFQEGLRLPILKLYDAGEPVDPVFKIVAANTRQPVQVLGDLRAQASACGVGEKGLRRLLSRYGNVAVRDYLEALHGFAERQMRAVIQDIPDGAYRYTDYIDGFGDEPEPLTVATTVTVEGDSISIDFAGTSPQMPAGINCPIAMARSASYCAIRCIGSRDIPNCEGYMRPVTVTAPEGSLLNPVLPAACGARGIMGYRVFDAIMAALAPVVPDKVIAAGEGGPSLFAIGGYHEGEPFVLTEVLVGTWGARATRDGIEGISNPAANLSNYPVELVEAEMPLEVVNYRFVEDSGGAGRQRGGLAFERTFRLRTDEAQLTVRADRRDHPPYGLDGALPGGPSMNTLWRNGDETLLPTMPMEALQLKQGDVFAHIAAGGGGFGAALERPAGQVLEDVRDGKVSVAAAAELYGVVIAADGLTLDADATAALRDSRVTNAALPE